MRGVRLLPFWSLWPNLALLAFQVLLVVAMWDQVFCRYVGVAGISMWVLDLYRSLDFNFILHAARCRSLFGKGFVVRYRKNLAQNSVLRACVALCQREYDDLVRLFGFSPRRKISVYLFGSPNEIARIEGVFYDLQCEGNFTVRLQAALVYYGCVKKEIDAILVTLHDDFQSLVRHEFAHLFARRMGPEAVSLKVEGLALWVEYKGRTNRLSDYALGVLKEKKGLEAFLDDTLFVDPSTAYASYEIAGSFTTFLIERFGWAAYCGFYKHAKHENFLASFEKAFSMTLADAEAQWREEAIMIDPQAGMLHSGSENRKDGAAVGY